MSLSQYQDSLRHRKWATELVKMAYETQGNKEYVQSLITKWMPLANKAIESYASAIPEIENASKNVKQVLKEFLETLDLKI